jgi:hypothetical protein
MQTKTAKRKFTISFDCLVANSFILMALLLMLAGCVEEHPGHYGTYPQDYTYSPPSHTTVIITHDDDDQRAYRANDEDDGHNYDNHWDYGRRGNGNFHGTGDDDVHGD